MLLATLSALVLVLGPCLWFVTANCDSSMRVGRRWIYRIIPRFASKFCNFYLSPRHLRDLINNLRPSWCPIRRKIETSTPRTVTATMTTTSLTVIHAAPQTKTRAWRLNEYFFHSRGQRPAVRGGLWRRCRWRRNWLWKRGRRHEEEKIQGQTPWVI